jgi:phosphate starvation-inducible PhoH-like protein
MNESFYDPSKDETVHLPPQKCSWLRSSRAKNQEAGSSKNLKITKEKRRQRLSKGKRSRRIENNCVRLTDDFSKRSNEVIISARNESQKYYLKCLDNPDNRITIATGPAGTGKTMLCVLHAIRALKNGDIKKIIISRPAVGVEGENHGYLPGNLDEKMEPWLLPILDVFAEHYNENQIQDMISNKIIDISPIAYMRGRSFKNCYIILDEAQNTTKSQMKMFLTRMGDNTKVIITGDLDQRDRQFHKDNGLHDFCQRIEACNPHGISLVNFSKKDVERDPMVAVILNMYGED